MMFWLRRLVIVLGIVVLGVLLMGASVFGYGAVTHNQKCDRLSAQLQAALTAPMPGGDRIRRQDYADRDAHIRAAQTAYNRECH